MSYEYFSSQNSHAQSASTGGYKTLSSKQENTLTLKTKKVIADKAFQLRGRQNDYDRVLKANNSQEEFDKIKKEMVADKAFQLRGKQQDYDRVLKSEEPNLELDKLKKDILDEMIKAGGFKSKPSLETLANLFM